MDGVETMRTFIKAVVPNANTSRIPDSINLVFDGGAFNGYYGVGVGMYIKELESRGLTSVKKVSGVSAGSLLALWYLIDEPKSDLNSIFIEMISHFKETHNLRIYKGLVKKMVLSNIVSDDLSFLNDRLYISYYDTHECCRKTVSKYKNRKHLIDVIIRSSHIPFVVTDSIAYKRRYIDGVRPELFDGSCRSLFVQVTTFDRISRMFYTGTEVNMLHRLVVGVADANVFFTTGSSDMCSFTDEWTIIGKTIFYLREFVLCVLYLILSKIVHGGTYIFDIKRAIGSATANIYWMLIGQEH